MMVYSKQFPILYHAHHSLHLDDLPFWLDLAARQGGPILELGCGTGRVLLPLARAGHRLYGLDNDARMLSFMKSLLPLDLLPEVNILQADLIHIPLRGRFPLVLLPCNTISTLPAAGRRACLSGVCAVLAPEGLFAASLPNPELLSRLPRKSVSELEEAFLHPLDGEPVQVSSTWERTADLFKLTWHYDHLLPDGRVERLSVQVNHYLTSYEELLAEFHACGLEVLDTYGDFDRSVYTSQAQNLILLARKGAY